MSESTAESNVAKSGEPSSRESHPISDEAAILSTVNAFLGCMKSKDRATMNSLILQDGSATLIRRGRPVHLTLREVPLRIPVDSAVQMDEQIYNSTVHVDGELGVAWTPYVFYEDGRLNHTGTNIFSMWKSKDRGWIITGIADISREVDEKAFDAFGEAELWKESQDNEDEKSN